jgi:hypothetical protein
MSKYNNLKIRGVLKTGSKIVFLFVFIFSIQYCNAQSKSKNVGTVEKSIKKDSISKEVINWIENYLLTGNYFERMEEDIGKPITSEKIKGWYHIHFIEKKNFDSLQVAIFQFGVNSSSAFNMMLIQKTFKSKSPEYQVIGDVVELQNAIRVYKFFDQYPGFSNDTKVIWYEYFTSSYYYSHK